MVRVTGTNQTKPDTDATLADAEEDKNYQKELDAEDGCDNDEDSDEDNEDVYLFCITFSVNKYF